MATGDAEAGSRSIRIAVAADALAVGGSVTLDEAQSRYLGTVMRRGPGDALRLFNGRDGEWLAIVETVTKRAVTLRLERQLRPQAAEPDLWLLLSIIKRDRFEWAVEKATELGVSRIQPVITAHSQPGRPNPERLESIAREAAEQSERLTIPEIAEAQPLLPLLGSWGRDRPLFAAIERQEAAYLPRAAGPAALLVGPEGGFNRGELDALGRLPFLVPATLGPRILRAETAAITGLALLQAGGGR